MEKSTLRGLLESYFQGRLTPQERESLLRATVENEPLIIELFNEMVAETSQFSQPANDLILKDTLRKVLSVDKGFAQVLPVNRKPLVLRSWFRWAAAAAIIGAITTAVVLSFDRRTSDSESTPIADVKEDVLAPQHNKARITLADGRVVSLDSLHDGLLAEQDGVRLVKRADGRIAYQATNGNATHEIRYNTLFNPPGSKVIDMILSDGSHVWLNAGSSITYPIAFAAKERKVSVVGEAYFEVARDVGKPFYVTKNRVEIQVLGTHFNVNAYDDESDIRVTVLEGSVRVSSIIDPGAAAGGKIQSSVVLQPRQQAVIKNMDPIGTASSDHQPKILEAVDLEAVMAWKNGLFSFTGADTKEVLRQLARWYDLEIVYEGAVPEITFGGEISRNASLLQALEILEKFNIDLVIKNKTLIVQP